MPLSVEQRRALEALVTASLAWEAGDAAAARAALAGIDPGAAYRLVPDPFRGVSRKRAPWLAAEQAHDFCAELLTARGVALPHSVYAIGAEGVPSVWRSSGLGTAYVSQTIGLPATEVKFEIIGATQGRRGVRLRGPDEERQFATFESAKAALPRIAAKVGCAPAALLVTAWADVNRPEVRTDHWIESTGGPGGWKDRD